MAFVDRSQRAGYKKPRAKRVQTRKQSGNDRGASLCEGGVSGGGMTGKHAREAKRNGEASGRNKSILRPPNYLNLHRIMNAAIKNNKKRE